MSGFLIDTVILIDHLSGIRKATGFLERVGVKDVFISVVTRAEVLCGLREGEEDTVQSLLDVYQCLPIDARTADLAARLRQEHRWKLPDAFQAALAIQYDLSLVTPNTRDFDRRKHSFVTIPYRL